MPRPKNAVPTYRLHKQSGQAVVTLNLNGTRRDVLLGKYGSPESKAEYERVLRTLRDPAGALALARGGPDTAHPDVTVAEVLVAFLAHADRHYRRPDGTPTSEVYNFKLSVRAVREMYAHTPAREFGPRALKAVRTRMVELGWCRKQINARVNRIRRVFKWAASEELIPAAVPQALATVAGLEAGRSAARETGPVLPVAAEHVRATLPHLLPEVAGMVEVQFLTGMRPGEVCVIRPCDVDTTGPVWVYRPPHHKLGYRGKNRAVAIGPKARAVLERFTPPDPADYYFSPARAVAALHAGRGRDRKTPRYPSHVARNAAKRTPAPGRPAAAVYKVTSYERAIRRGVERANRALVEAGVDVGLHVPHWHPNRLRHAHATEVRKRFGLEAAQVALGHANAAVTEIYAEKNLALAATVAAAIG